MSWTLECFCRGWAAPFFVGQTGTAAQRPFVPTLFKCCGLVIKVRASRVRRPSWNWGNYCLCSFIPYFVFSIATTISFIPLFLLSPGHSVFCVTYCLTAGMLSADSLLPLSLKNRKNPSVFILFDTIYLPLFWLFFLFLFLNIVNRIVALLMCTCIVRCFINECSFVPGFQWHKLVVDD